jgi:hypothetical protein
MLSFGLPAIETCTSIACCHCHSERCFSAMKIVKTYLRNRLNDGSLSDNLICYVEKEEMKKVTNDLVVDRFMKLRGRKF